jgi:hypothetical protein
MMRYLKALGLAVLAALAAMALVCSGTAAAEADKEIVLCEELVELTGLCPEEKYLRQGSEISGLASGAKIISTLGTVECQDSLIVGLLGADMGKILTVTVTGIVFGVLPTPELGKGCTTCTGGVHSAVPVGGWFEVEPLDDFYFKLEKVTFTLLNCPGGLTCTYTSGEFKSLVDRDAVEHPDWKGKKKDVILVARALTRSGGSFFCPANAEWKGEYILTLAKNTDQGTRLFYLALEQLGEA